MPALPQENATSIRRLLTERQASDKLAVSPRTLQNWRRYGEGPRFVKLGAAVRYVDSDLDAWIDEQIRRSTSDSGHEAA